MFIAPGLLDCGISNVVNGCDTSSIARLMSTSENIYIRKMQDFHVIYVGRSRHNLQLIDQSWTSTPFRRISKKSMIPEWKTLIRWGWYYGAEEVDKSCSLRLKPQHGNYHHQTTYVAVEHESVQLYIRIRRNTTATLGTFESDMLNREVLINTQYIINVRLPS